MHFRKQDVLLAGYIVVAGALLSAAPAQAEVDEQCFDSWFECLDALSQTPCSGHPACPPGGPGTPCDATQYRIACWADM